MVTTIGTLSTVAFGLVMFIIRGLSNEVKEAKAETALAKEKSHEIETNYNAKFLAVHQKIDQVEITLTREINNSTKEILQYLTK